MSVLSRIHHAQRIKPMMWPASYGWVAPEWRWMWQSDGILVPFWYQAQAFDHIRKEAGVPTGDNADQLAATVEPYGNAIQPPAQTVERARYVWARGDIGDVDVTFLFVGKKTSSDFSNTVSTSGSNAGMRLGTDADDFLVFSKGGVADVDSTITLSLDVPYALGISYRASDGQIDYVARDMLSGAIQTDTQTNTQTPNAGDGDWSVGGTIQTTFDGLVWPGPYGFAGLLLRRFTPAELRAWALDPFGSFRMARRTWVASQFQVLRPASDVSNPDGWQNELGSTTDIWQSIDEETPDAADFVESPA